MVGSQHYQEHVFLDGADSPAIAGTDPRTRTAAQGNCLGRPRVLGKR